ncbi:hypothetical protein TELCIR_23900, partial [Teladorsagia circumcincta]
MSPNRVSRTATVLHLMSAELISQYVVLECQNRDVCRAKPIRTLRESLSRAQPTELLHPALSTTSATTTAICLDVVQQKVQGISALPANPEVMEFVLAFTCSLASNPGKTCGPGVSFKFYYNAQTQ